MYNKSSVLRFKGANQIPEQEVEGGIKAGHTCSMYYHMYSFMHYVTFAKLLFSLSFCLCTPPTSLHSLTLHLSHRLNLTPPFCGSAFHPPPSPPTSLSFLSPSLVPEPGGSGRLHGSGPQQWWSPEEPGPVARGWQCKCECVLGMCVSARKQLKAWMHY